MKNDPLADQILGLFENDGGRELASGTIIDALNMRTEASTVCTKLYELTLPGDRRLSRRKPEGKGAKWHYRLGGGADSAAAEEDAGRRVDINGEDVVAVERTICSTTLEHLEHAAAAARAAVEAYIDESDDPVLGALLDSLGGAEDALAAYRAAAECAAPTADK